MAWSISDWVYEGVNLSLSAVEPRGIWLAPLGTQVYVIDAADDRVKEFNLGVVDNISTGSASGDEFQLEAGAQGLTFNPDGTVMTYIDGQDIVSRTLSTGFDVTTAGAAVTLDVSADLASSDPQDVFWGDSGDKLFFTDDNDQHIYLYDCGTPYDISTATFNALTDLDISSRFPLGEGLGGIFWEDDGTTLFVGVDHATAGSFTEQSPAVRQYDVSTPWDLDTAAESNTGDDPDFASLLSFMPHFYSADYDWVIGRNHAGTTGTVAFHTSESSGAWLGGLATGEGGMWWDDADNAQAWGVTRLADATWEGTIHFFRKPDNAGLGGDNRLCLGSSNSPHFGHSVGTLARPWSLIWNDVNENFGLMASGSGIHVSAGPEGGDWFYGTNLDFTVQRVAAGGTLATFAFWLNGKFYGTRTTTQNVNFVEHAWAYGKNGGIAGWDFASGVRQVWSRCYSVAKYSTTYTDHSFTEHDIDMTALGIIGRSVVEETGRESTATYIAFNSDGGFGYVGANDPTNGNFIYQYNLGDTIPSCTGEDFEEYVSGGTARLHVTTFDAAHHLEGLTVTGIVNGELTTATVVNGQPVFPQGINGGIIQVGFPFTADIVTLDIEEGDGAMQGKDKAVRELLLKFYKSAMPLIGPKSDELVQMKHPERDNFDEPLPLYTGKVRQRIERDWNPSGKVTIRMKDPYPMTVVSLAPDVPDVEDDK